MTKKSLAEAIGVSPMAITYYESDKRRPNIETIRLLAQALNVNVTDFLRSNSENLRFVHGKFRKTTRLSETQQNYIRESVEEYCERFFQVLSILGDDCILKSAPKVKSIDYSNDIEDTAVRLRSLLGVSNSGPVGSLVDLLEHNGILVIFVEVDSKLFSGMNGMVNDIPYIVVNESLAPARMRSTMVHELAHIFVNWPENFSDKEEEEYSTSISGSFLFPKKDVFRELGYKCTFISKSMTMVCKRYGISMFMLVKRAKLCNVINSSVEREFYIKASKAGWRTNEPTWDINKEETILFKKLVYRAVTEKEISIQKGAELLRSSYDSVVSDCFI